MTDKETLREAEYFRQQVAVDIEIAVYEKTDLQLTDKQGEAAADAAIATMFEHLRNMPNEVADGIAKKHFVSFEVAKLIGRDIATAFQQENSDAANN